MVETKIPYYENWIFDWSGTLVDDLTMVLDATNHVMRQYGKREIDLDEFKAHFRLPYAGYYEEILPGIPLEELEGHFRKGFEDSKASGVTSPLLPHAVDLLNSLHKRNRRMFVLTSMDAPAFDFHVEELGVKHFFEATYAGALDKRTLIKEMIAGHGMDVGTTVFLGDMCHDVETARHGGIASIALLTGYQNAEQLAQSDPDLVADDLSHVSRMLGGM